ncbi:MAG: fibronectin type III domain-containing protein [Chloroflexi bacterium]|nr:fibronectin type III domain-containing protein [Ardenticatenaceae bacterium]NOG37096.1 fibronectin type III domain-containing protein [Chloroflexota bacterium]
MKQKMNIFMLVACLLVGWAWSVAGQDSDGGFIIENADDTAYLNMVASAELNALIANVAPHMIVEFANALRDYDMVAVPGGLQTLLQQVAPRMVIEFANANRFYTLDYPAALIGDTAVPQVSGVSATSSGDNVTVRWTTNEYTTSVLQHGTQSGVYPTSVEDNWYRLSHAITLSGLTPGATYYYRLQNTDRSGNSAQSGEYSFTATQSVYLPVIVR